MAEGRRIEGTVLVLRCRACAAEFPNFQFSGDTDIVTEGLLSVSSRARREIVIAEAEADEWVDPSGSAFARRISRQLDRDDLRFVALRRTEGGTKPGWGEPFRDYLARARPPDPIFGCPWCGGEARVVETLDASAFEAGGGRLTLLGGLRL